jgi:hypothetical protein
VLFAKGRRVFNEVGLYEKCLGENVTSDAKNGKQGEIFRSSHDAVAMVKME